MPPYPFYVPTFAEFKATLLKLGCKYKSHPAQLNDSEGKSYDLFYFERNFKGKILTCVVDLMNDQEKVMPTVIRSICARLKINPRDCGLDLG